MKFRDRLTGATVELPSAPLLLGRWSVASEDGASPVRMNRCEVAAGDYLVPGPTGRWELTSPGAAETQTGRFHAGALPDQQDEDALTQLGLMLGERASGGWVGWLGASPLAPGLDQAVAPHPLEDHIEKEVPHLEAVCLRPRTHIRVEPERVLVARARRIDRRAPEWLSSHTEDWEHRKISGIHPRRVLAHVREEDWDLYENRVAAGLVDDLVIWLRRRVSSIRRVLEDIFQRMESYAFAPSGNRHRIDRIYKLWGESWDAAHGTERAQKTLARLERLLYRVLALIDSPLYRTVPRRSRVSGRLRVTNLLGNDDHYRGVARLWHAWERLSAPGRVSPADHHARLQRLCRGFDDWVMLLVVRACDQLGFEPTDAGLAGGMRPGTTIELVGELELEWEPSGCITLRSRRASSDLLRVLPLLHTLQGARGTDGVGGRVEALVTGVPDDTDAWTVVVHLAHPDAAPDSPVATVDNPPAPGTWGAVDFVAVSPFQLDAVERVARVIRWAVLAPTLMAYPPRLGQLPRDVDVDGHDWLLRDGGGAFAVVRSLHPQEEQRLDLQAKLRAAKNRRDALVAERQSLVDALQSAKDHRRDKRKLNMEKGRLLPEIHGAEEEAAAWATFAEGLQGASTVLYRIERCPVCGERAALSPRAHDTFAAECPSDSCCARWGLRLDGDDGARVPYLLPGGVSSELFEEGPQPRVVEDLLGSDLLTIPYRERGGDIGFLPPRGDRFGRVGQLVARR